MSNVNKIRLLLADDNQSILRLLTDFFARKEDIDVVTTVSDGTEIADAVREFQPDVLVMDIIMPRRDGFMALEELRHMEEPRPKVIVLTGLARDDFIARAIELGASYYMVKPFDMHLLYSRIVEIAGKNAFSPEAGQAQTVQSAESLDERVTNLFLTLGIPAHIKGYQYLREAVLHGGGESRCHQPHHQGALSRRRAALRAPRPARSSAQCGMPSRWPGAAAGLKA